MAKISVYNQDCQVVGETELDDRIFGQTGRNDLLHFVVRKQLAARRQGTHAARRRSDISGGGRKPWKQKGTGRARQGSTRSPQWRGGGVVFGPLPRSHDFKVNKKQMRSALCVALSRRVSAGDVVVLNDLDFLQPKTKEFVAFMEKFELPDALLVLGDERRHVELAARNVAKATVVPPVGVNVYDVLRRKKLVLTRSAVDALVLRLGGG